MCTVNYIGCHGYLVAFPVVESFPGRVFLPLVLDGVVLGVLQSLQQQNTT